VGFGPGAFGVRGAIFAWVFAVVVVVAVAVGDACLDSECELQPTRARLKATAVIATALSAVVFVIECLLSVGVCLAEPFAS
jgi:hypothetical protein